jgi:formate hydrogenlyase subunit 3/multisubunit Na+/H+ antiporter MnhD subunit
LLALAGFPPFALFVGDVITLQAVRVQQSGMAIMMAIGWLTMAMIALIRLRGVRR